MFNITSGSPSWMVTWKPSSRDGRPTWMPTTLVLGNGGGEGPSGGGTGGLASTVEGTSGLVGAGKLGKGEMEGRGTWCWVEGAGGGRDVELAAISTGGATRGRLR